ncbi:hypothetical protein GN109_15155, partial [Collimonas pratensis]|uniref:hypothetical protein n=1 Tax=Collimonas pratensis TaxID=279113 RepID=UPI00143D28A9
MTIISNTVGITISDVDAEILRLFPLIKQLNPELLHSPAEKRAHDTLVQERWNAVDKYKRAQHQAAVAAQAKTNAPLSENDYYQQALARQAERKEQELAREVAEA